MFSTSVRRRLCAAGATVLMAVMVPLGAVGVASASQQGDDHKVTLCHRTNSANNPYVVITIDKAAVFKRGHDTHDEGGVYQPGDKEAGIRWGDIIPAFDYFESPKSTTTTHYAGLNNTQAGLDILANDCEVEGEGETPEPTGTFTLPCVPTGGDVVIFSDDIDSDGAQNVQYRLLVNGSPVSVTETELEAGAGYPVPNAVVGSTITLQHRIGGGDFVTLDGPKTAQACGASSGSYTVVCAPNGQNAVVTVGTLADGGDGGEFALSSTFGGTTTNSVVNSTGTVNVPLGANLALTYTTSQGDKSTVAELPDAPVNCSEQGTVEKTSVPASGANVAPGSTIAYTVTVTNTGQVALTNKQVVDTLPTFVTVQGTPSDSGVVSGDGRSITWTVTLAPGASKTFTYTGLVVANAPDGSVLVNTATFLGQQDTTTHTVDVVAVQGTQSGNTPADDDTAVEGTKTGSAPPTSQQTEVLAATGGPGTRALWLSAAALVMLLVGSALVAWPRRLSDYTT